MKHTILAFDGSNMAKQEWRWSFDLEQLPDRTFTLTATQVIFSEDEGDERDPEDEPIEVEPAVGLRGGVDIFAELKRMLDEGNDDIERFDLEPIAEKIAAFDPKIAGHFLRGKRNLAGRERRAGHKAYRTRDTKLSPFLEAISAYCAGLSDDRTRGGGGISRPSERMRVRAFLEQYVVDHQKLPSGKQNWQLGNGFLSGSHDFSDLGEPKRV